MNEQPAKAWQPLTFGGVARYGYAWVGRVLFACLIVSILTASVALWTVSRAWFPVIEEAITHLPPGAEIRGGKLTAPQATRLAENTFLSITLDPLGEPPAPSLADIQVLLRPTEIQFRSIFGMAVLPYRPEWTIDLNRNDWEPRWQAWRPAVLVYLFFGTIIWLFVSWIGLGILYAIPVRLLALILRRQISLWGSFKLSVAGLLPAAFLLTVALAIYGLGQIRAPELMFTWALHLIVGWIFIIGATARLPHRQVASNPFGEGNVESEKNDDDPVEEKNPFKRPAKKK